MATEVNTIKTHLKDLRNKTKTAFSELVITGAERNRLKNQVDVSLRESYFLKRLKMHSYVTFLDSIL